MFTSYKLSIDIKQKRILEKKYVIFFFIQDPLGQIIPVLFYSLQLKYEN